MAPDLVIADAPYKRYPGYVIAVRCTDWLGPARGTLSTEVDGLASTGGAVRDEQQVNNILTNPLTAYAAADDTLEITGLPFLESFNYGIYVSYRLEGYLDLTDGPLLRQCFNETWEDALIVGMHGGTIAEASAQLLTQTVPILPHYRMGFLGTIGRGTDPASTTTLFVRAFSDTGTTIEVLLDQIVFVPFSPIVNGNFIQGSEGMSNTPFVDGADGGDVNGKFTYFPFPPADQSTPGDYQRKSDGDDAEWFMRLLPDDGNPLFADDDVHLPAWMYSLHCAGYRGERVWTEDTFDNRTTAGKDFGLSPEGFGYVVVANSTNATFVSGGVGILQQNSLAGGGVAVTLGGAPAGTPPTLLNQGMRFMVYDQWEWSGVWELTNDGTLVRVELTPLNGGAGTDANMGYIRFSCLTATWVVVYPDGTTSASFDVSAWFGVGALVGFRIEASRYVTRYRIWDASGAEPGTWDEESFYYIDDDPYDYADDLDLSTQIADPPVAGMKISAEERDITSTLFPVEIQLHSMLVEHNPYGDPEDMSARIEHPEGTVAGEIVVPYGAPYFVFWGKRDWTGYNADDDAWYIEFSAKVWNDPAAAEIQRAEADFFYLWWLEDLNIIPMNWRSADRSPHGQNRILTGG